MRQLKIIKQLTNRDSLSLEKYLHEIGKEELLTIDEEVELGKRIKKGDEKALEQLVMANLRFVVSVAKQYQNRGLSLPDLINEGNLGLIKAASRFDETRGFRFISYAVWWVRQAILQALAEQSRIVRLPLNKIGLVNKVNRAFNNLEQKHQRDPTLDELAELVESSVEMIEDAMSFSNFHISIDAPLHDDESETMHDVLLNENSPSPDAELIVDSLRQEIERTLSTLSHREAEILRYYFGLNECPHYTLEEIGSEFGLTRERVRQIKEKAIKKLRNQYHNRLLKAYLGQ